MKWLLESSAPHSSPHTNNHLSQKSQWLLIISDFGINFILTDFVVNPPYWLSKLLYIVAFRYNYCSYCMTGCTVGIKHQTHVRHRNGLVGRRGTSLSSVLEVVCAWILFLFRARSLLFGGKATEDSACGQESWRKWNLNHQPWGSVYHGSAAQLSCQSHTSVSFLHHLLSVQKLLPSLYWDFIQTYAMVPGPERDRWRERPA